MKKLFSPAIIVLLVIVSIVSSVATTGYIQKTLLYDNIKITLDGTEIIPVDANGTYVEPFIIDGTTYLPVRGISNALGLGVDWDGNTNTVILTRPETAEESPEAAKKEFSLGKTEGTVYENEFIGFGCDLGEGWVFRTDEEIKALNNVTQTIVGEEYVEILKQADTVYDMLAAKGVDNINVNLKKSDEQAIAAINNAVYYKLIAPAAVEMLESMGCENVSYEVIEITVDGVTRNAIHLTSNFLGVNMYQTVFQHASNGYIATVTVTTCTEDTTFDIIGKFYWLD